MTPLKTVLMALTASLILCGFSLSSAYQRKPTKASERECFLGRQVGGFSAVTDSLVDIQVGADRYYRLASMDPAPDATFRNRIALRTLSGGTWICQDKSGNHRPRRDGWAAVPRPGHPADHQGPVAGRCRPRPQG